MKNLMCLASILLFAITTYAQNCNMNENAQSHYAKAGVAIEQAKTETDYLFAIDELKKALIDAPNCPDLYYNLGLAYEKSADTGKPEKDIFNLKQAITNFKKYLDMSPDAQDRETVKSKISELEVKYDKLSAPIIKKARKPVYFGILGGLNFSNYSYSSSSSKQIDIDPYITSDPGFQFGIFLEFRLSDIISIQPGVNISGRKPSAIFKFADQDQYLIGNVFTTDSPNYFMYFDFPINLLCKYKISKSTWYVGVGPVISYSMLSSYKYGNNDYSYGYNYYSDYSLQEIPKTTIGINFKLGYSIHKFFIELGYNAGMTNISQDPDISLKNSYTFSSLGLKF